MNDSTKPFPPVWTEQRAIGWLDVDMLGRIRPQALFAFLLDAASNHAEGSALDTRSWPPGT